MAGGFKGSMVSASLSAPLSVLLSPRREDSPVPSEELSEGSAGAQAKRAVASRGHKRMERMRFAKEKDGFIDSYLPYEFTYELISKYSIPKTEEKSNIKMRVSLTEKYFYVILKKRCRESGIWIVI